MSSLKTHSGDASRFNTHLGKLYICPVFVRPAAEALPQAPAAPADLDRDSHRLDGVGPSKGNASVVPPQGCPAASRD